MSTEEKERKKVEKKRNKGIRTERRKKVKTKTPGQTKTAKNRDERNKKNRDEKNCVMAGLTSVNFTQTTSSTTAAVYRTAPTPHTTPGPLQLAAT